MTSYPDIIAAPFTPLPLLLKVAKVIESLSKDSWASVCQKDLEKFGQSLQGFKDSVCQVNPQAIAGDFSKLLKIDVLQVRNVVNVNVVLFYESNIHGGRSKQGSIRSEIIFS